MSVEPTTLTQEQKNEITDYINMYRTKHSAPIKEEPIKEEPIKEEPIKEEPIKEEPIKEEAKKNILYLIENLLYLIRAGYKRRVVLQSLDIIINEVLMNKENTESSKLEEVNRLYYVKYLLESGKSLYYVFQPVLSIFLRVEDQVRGL
jgi:hypothetical protein